MNDKAIMEELGERVRQQRLNQNITQTALAKKAGVARSVVQKLEYGEKCMLVAMIKILRALGLLDHLNTFLPAPEISPLQLAQLQTQKKQRASGKRRLNKKNKGG